MSGKGSGRAGIMDPCARDIDPNQNELRACAHLIEDPAELRFAGKWILVFPFLLSLRIISFVISPCFLQARI